MQAEVMIACDFQNFKLQEPFLRQLFFELLGEIFDYLVANGRMKEKDVRSKFRQVVLLLYY